MTAERICLVSLGHLASNPRLVKEADALQESMDRLLAAGDFEGLRKLIVDQKIGCAISGTCNWTEVRQFNLMFSTQLGSVADEASEIRIPSMMYRAATGIDRHLGGSRISPTQVLVFHILAIVPGCCLGLGLIFYALAMMEVQKGLNELWTRHSIHSAPPSIPAV